MTATERAVGDAAGHHEQRLPRWRRAVSAAFTLTIFAAVILLWPAQLGGSTRLVIVAGHSMEPTYDLGDIVVTRDRGAADVGDPVVFTVPEGDAGAGILVIHRITGVDPEGFFMTQGDNRATPDRWQLTEDDIVGQPLVVIPNGGHVVFFLQQWIVIAVLAGLLTVFVLWPTGTRTDDETDEATTVGEGLDGAGDAQSTWNHTEIDQAVMDAAEAWLDEQLASILQPVSIDVGDR